jgi:hypothetical protein
LVWIPDGNIWPGEGGAALAAVAPNIAAAAMAITDRMRFMCAPFFSWLVVSFERQNGGGVPIK